MTVVDCDCGGKCVGSEKVVNGLHSHFPSKQLVILDKGFVNTSELSIPIVAPDLVVDEIFISVCINVNIDVSSTCHTK